MAIVNGTLKYKQDDGSIMELGPVGVDARARTLATAAGQIANNAQTAAENVQQTVDVIATQIELIEQTTGYNAIPEDVPATSIKESIEDLDTEVRNLDTEVRNLDTRVKKLEPASFFIPLYGFCSGTGNNMCTITVPKPAYLRHIEQKGYFLSYTVSGGTVGNVLHFFTNGEITTSPFTPTIIDHADFITIDCTSLMNGIPSIGSVVFGDYTSAAYATSIKVTVSK